MNIEEVFRKLRPIMGSQLDTLWQEYLAEGEYPIFKRKNLIKCALP